MGGSGSGNNSRGKGQFQVLQQDLAARSADEKIPLRERINSVKQIGDTDLLYYVLRESENPRLTSAVFRKLRHIEKNYLVSKGFKDITQVTKTVCEKYTLSPSEFNLLTELYKSNGEHIVAPLYPVIRNGEQIGYGMEYLNGWHTFQSLIAMREPLEVLRQVHEQVQQTLLSLHRVGKYHGDPNFGNVMVYYLSENKVHSKLIDPLPIDVISEGIEYDQKSVFLQVERLSSIKELKEHCF